MLLQPVGQLLIRGLRCSLARLLVGLSDVDGNAELSVSVQLRNRFIGGEVDRLIYVIDSGALDVGDLREGMRLAGQKRVPNADSKVILVEEIGRVYQKLSGKTGGKAGPFTIYLRCRYKMQMHDRVQLPFPDYQDELNKAGRSVRR